MSSQQEAPPSYAQATGSSTTSASSHLQIPQSRNGIPAASRRSMEDEHRPLPEGWVRQWDNKEQHQFFVDTKTDPPRAIWHHPYDDSDYLKTLSSEEREHIQESERGRKVKYDTTDDESATPPPSSSSSKKKTGASLSTSTATATATATAAAATGSVSATDNSKEKTGFGRKLKDKVTGTTHEERQADRVRREREEQEYYEAHMKFRAALQRAQMTGQPQFLAKDREGREVYVEPPQSAYGSGGGYGQGGYGYNPYGSGPYANPNARFIRPPAPYGRPYGAGYGGGYGFPIAGGLLGGMLLGGLLF